MNLTNISQCILGTLASEFCDASCSSVEMSFKHILQSTWMLLFMCTFQEKCFEREKLQCSVQNNWGITQVKVSPCTCLKSCSVYMCIQTMWGPDSIWEKESSCRQGLITQYWNQCKLLNSAVKHFFFSCGSIILNVHHEKLLEKMSNYWGTFIASTTLPSCESCLQKWS